MHVERPSLHHITLSQTLYINKIKERYDLGGTSPHTPSIKGHAVSKDLGTPDKHPEQLKKRYQSLLGALLYCTISHPDMCVFTGDMTRISKPTPTHMKLLRRGANYVVSTADLKLQFKPN